RSAGGAAVYANAAADLCKPGDPYGRGRRDTARRRARAPACRPISASSAAAWTAVSRAPGVGSRGGAGAAAAGVGLAAAAGLGLAAAGLALGAVRVDAPARGFAAGFLAALALAGASAFTFAGAAASTVAGAAAVTTSGSCAWLSRGGAPAGAGRFALRRWGRVRGSDPITPGLGSSLMRAQSWRTDRNIRREPKFSFYL